MMNCSLPKITYPALRTLLRFRLYGAIGLQIEVSVKKVSTTTHQNNFDASKVKLLLKSIQLKQVRNDTFTIIYQSAIALKLSSVLRRDSSKLAYQILDEFHLEDVNFCQENLTAAQCILSDFTSKVVHPGLLQFELGDRGLSVWLQCLMNSPLPNNSIEPIPRLTSRKKPLTQTPKNGEQLFICQHSYARCCSLLRLAHESVITLNCLEVDDLWMILTPNPIPWLTAQGHLCLVHPAERALISQLVAIVDDFSNLIITAESCLKSALALSNSFQNFHGACQIFELMSPSSLQRSQARLGLVMATQRLLKDLLDIGLNAKTPSEL